MRSTTDTSGTGTRNAIPVSLPFSSGMTLPTAFAAPVEAGITFWWAPRPSRHFWRDKGIDKIKNHNMKSLKLDFLSSVAQDFRISLTCNYMLNVNIESER